MYSNPQARSDIVQALLNDNRFKFKDKGDYLRDGICPNCKKKELFISKNNPWQVKCSRESNCQYEQSTRQLLPDLFNHYSERFPKTTHNPNATADAYLSHNRGFNLEKIKGWYQQEAHKDPKTGQSFDTIRFYLNEAKTRYWERLIDAPKDVKKAHFGGQRKSDGSLYRGDVWQPPCLEIKKHDCVWIVEGILHAIALYHVNIKAVAAFSCNNFPENFITQHKDKKIQWVMALDADPAGLKYTQRHKKKMNQLGQACRAALLPDYIKDVDWDDLYRAGKLNERFILNCLNHGDLYLAETPAEKAYFYYIQNGFSRFVLPFNSAIYAFKKGDDVEKALSEDKDNAPIDIKSREGKTIFEKYVEIEQISNCSPVFLYQQVDEILNERKYIFKIDYINGAPPGLVELFGSNLESPSAFNKALLNVSSGGSFDGSAKQFKFLRDGWLNRRLKRVYSVPFVGYDSEVNAWIFQQNAFYNGQKISLNSEGYFDLGTTGINTNLKSLQIKTDGDHKPAWILDFLTAFHWQGISLLAFFLGSLFVQQIRQKQSSWPFFELTGEPGAGKSTALEFCWKLLGRKEYEGFDVNDATRAGLRRTFNSVSNLPVVLIESDRYGLEYKESIKKNAFNFEQLKKLYNGRGTGVLGVARRNNEVEEQLFLGSLMVSQNIEIDGSQALLERFVQCHADKKHFSEDSQRLSEQLFRMPIETLCGFLSESLKNENKILQTYFKKYNECFTRFQKNGTLKTPRIIKCHSQLAAMGYALPFLFPHLTTQHCQMLEAYLFKRAHTREQRIKRDHPVVDLFWDQFEYMNEMPYKNCEHEGIHHNYLDHSKNDDEIAINFNHFQKIADIHRQERIDITLLKKLIVNSKRHPLKDKNKSIASRLLNKTVKCWIFSRNRTTL